MGVYSEVWPVSGQPFNLGCDHVGYTPQFDVSSCQWKGVSAIREQFPRYHGICSQCQQRVTVYASYEHYKAVEGWHWPVVSSAPVNYDYWC